jgi:Spy/CpxP family protein refolding chaperone
MRVVSTVLALAVSLAIASSLFAQDKEKKAPREGRGRGGAMDRIDGMVRNLNLTDDQKAKLEEIKKEYAPKFKEAAEKSEGILTPEQKTARKEAMKAAREAGKRGPEVRKEIEAAMKLTDEQKAKMADARKAMEALQKEVRGKVMEILTPEQKAKLEQQAKERGGRRGRSHGGDGK